MLSTESSTSLYGRARMTCQPNEDSVLSIYGARLFAQYLQTADVTVDPRYGRWDAESGSIVTLT